MTKNYYYFRRSDYINPEIIYKSWKKAPNLKKIYLISNHKLLIKQFDKLKYPIKLIKVNL